MALFVCLGGSACASRAPELDPARIEQLEAALLRREPPSPAERMESARGILFRDRVERADLIRERFTEACWRIFQNASPSRIWSGVRRTASAVWKFNRRTSAEDLALDQLEATPGDLRDAEHVALVEKLRKREASALASERVAAAELALDHDRPDVARTFIDRALVLEPDSKAARKQVDELARRAAEVEPEPEQEPDLVIRDGDVPLAEALLARDYPAATNVEPADPQLRFAHAAAHLLAGNPEHARSDLAELEEDGGPVGAMATRWLDRPEVDAERELDHAIHRYRIQRILGWIGGNALAERDLMGLRSISFSAWKDALTPANIGLSLPARIVRGFKPDGRAVREAAIQYLEQDPHGPRAEKAREWLDHVGWPRVDVNRFQSVFELPPVQTPYDPLAVQPLVLSRRAAKSDQITNSSMLGSALEGAPGVWLEARESANDDEGGGFAFTPRKAHRLLDEIAFAVGAERFRWTLGSQDSVLERLRQLDNAVGRGRVLFAEGWVPGDASLLGALGSTLIDGESEPGRVRFERGDDDVLAVRTLGDEVRECPRGTLCLDLKPRVRTALYGYVNVESGAGLGFQSALGHSGIALAVTGHGPEAALLLPLGRWLGIYRWLPLEFEVAISADRLYVGPILRKARCLEGRNPEDTRARQELPFGLGNRCVLRAD
jgi:hypothetical protein